MAQKIYSERFEKKISLDTDLIQSGFFTKSIARPKTDSVIEKCVAIYDESANGGNLPNVRDFNASDLVLIRRVRLFSPAIFAGLIGYSSFGLNLISFHGGTGHAFDSVSNSVWCSSQVGLGEWIDVNGTISYEKDFDSFRLGLSSPSTIYFDGSRCSADFISKPLDLYIQVELAHTLQTVPPPA